MSATDIFHIWNKCAYKVAIYRRAWKFAVERGDFVTANKVRIRGLKVEEDCGIFETWIWDSVSSGEKKNG